MTGGSAVLQQLLGLWLHRLVDHSVGMRRWWRSVIALLLLLLKLLLQVLLMGCGQLLLLML